MSKKIDEYNKTKFIAVIFRLKPDEAIKFDKILKDKKLSRRKYLIDKMDKENINEINL